ncbi:hypothetical protein [Tsukamurella soli]|uniref:hypothetical protein n=1 Tax=Tsukamurella soli TaxID=644556 RepID=UPI0031E7E549
MRVGPLDRRGRRVRRYGPDVVFDHMGGPLGRDLVAAPAAERRGGKLLIDPQVC